ncbi:MAG TPA: ATP-dependent DNA helicase RecG [Candidatus Limnocylindrales bacterium]
MTPTPARGRTRSGGPQRPAAGRAPAAILEPGTPVGSSGIPGASVLRRLGPRLGIRTVEDLLFHLPRRYDDLRELRTARGLLAVDDGETASARLQVRGLRVEQTFRRRVQRTTAYLGDATGDVEATWFGRRFIERRLREGDWVVVSGRVRQRGFVPSFDNPDFGVDDGEGVLHAGRIVPVYRLTAGLTAATLRRAIRAALDRLAGFPEYLPAPLVASADLLPIGEAVEQAHYPATFEWRDAALRRLAFDELLALQLGMVARRRAREGERSTRIVVAGGADGRAREAIATALGRRAGLPVALTDDQVRAMDAVRDDMAGPAPMLRLLQGDVGSGKTAVAAHALALAAAADCQGALLAPTDLLARQHAATLGDLLADLGLRPVLLTGSLPPGETAAALAAIAGGDAAVVVGTHALFQERVTFARLGLAIVDEQHRFGVEQRTALEAKATGAAPHVLLMTATPIPRTVGQVLYADLDVSDLRTAPMGRLRIRTGVRHPDDVGRLWSFVAEEARAGHRAFVVVPRIGDEELDGEAGDEAGDVAAAEAEHDRLAALLAPLPVGLVHGRLRPAERDARMDAFRRGEVPVLVGTTVVEVGVDVPEATVMVIEDAERFGLAQLHQLRGRVGRGSAQSYCVLVSAAAASTREWEDLVHGRRTAESTEQARLVAVATTRDGFALAEADFELRREGDVLGFAQSGLPRLRVASLQRADHRELAIRARAAAEDLLGGSADLETALPLLRRELTSGWLARTAAAEPTAGA